MHDNSVNTITASNILSALSQRYFATPVTCDEAVKVHKLDNAKRVFAVRINEGFTFNLIANIVISKVERYQAVLTDSRNRPGSDIRVPADFHVPVTVRCKSIITGHELRHICVKNVARNRTGFCVYDEVSLGREKLRCSTRQNIFQTKSNRFTNQDGF